MSSSCTAATAHWEKRVASNAPCPRSSHQLSGLGSKIFLFGGESGPEHSHFGYGIPVPSTEVMCLDLDSPTNEWGKVPASGDKPSARLGHGQSILVDTSGRAFLYVFGGRRPIHNNLNDIQSLGDLYRLDLESGVWEEITDATGDAPSPRSYHQIVAIGNMLYVFAGMINDTRYNDMYAFDTQKRHWSRLSSSPRVVGRGGPGLCVIGDCPKNASLVVVAGFCGRPMADVWQYRIATDQWLEQVDWTLPVARSIFACGTLSFTDAKIVAFGGELENLDATLIEQGQDPTLQASIYTNETLLLYSDNSNRSIRIVDAGQNSPCPRGWTAGCSVTTKGTPCFVVFGGVRNGQGNGEPSGVRLGDLWILHVHE